MAGTAVAPQTSGFEALPPAVEASNDPDALRTAERAGGRIGTDARVGHAHDSGPAITPPFWLTPWETPGSPRSPIVMDAAREVWQPILAYTEQALGDTEAAPDLLEKTVRRVERSRKKRAIRELGAYIFKSYTREVAAERRRRRRLLQLDESIFDRPHPADEMERRILAKEVIGMIRAEILPLVFRRMAGWSWDEIAVQLGEPKHALESRYSFEICRVKDLLRTTTAAQVRPINSTLRYACPRLAPRKDSRYKGGNRESTLSGGG